MTNDNLKPLTGASRALFYCFKPGNKNEQIESLNKISYYEKLFDALNKSSTGNV